MVRSKGLFEFSYITLSVEVMDTGFQICNKKKDKKPQRSLYKELLGSNPLFLHYDLCTWMTLPFFCMISNFQCYWIAWKRFILDTVWGALHPCTKMVVLFQTRMSCQCYWQACISDTNNLGKCDYNMTVDWRNKLTRNSQTQSEYCQVKYRCCNTTAKCHIASKAGPCSLDFFNI